MTTSQAQMDASLGTLAATAAEAGCPPEQVRRMCEASEFTRGLDTVALSGAVSGTFSGTVGVSGVSGAAVPGGDGCGTGQGIGDLVTTVAGAVEGFAGGAPGQGLCGDRDALAAADTGWQGAVGSVDSCIGAVETLTAGCTQAVGALVEGVCSLAGPALACGSAVTGTLAGELVRGAVDTVTGMLEQRNCGLGALVDITVGDCTTAAGPGDQGCPGTVPEPQPEPDREPSDGECPQQPRDQGCPEPEPAPDCPEPTDTVPEEAVPEDDAPGDTVENGVAETVDAGTEEPGDGASGSVDPVHGFDKADRIPVDDAPTVLSAGAGEAGSDGADAGGSVTDGAAVVSPDPGPDTAPDQDPADSGWDPDLWVTAGEATDDPGQGLPETAGAW